MVSVQDVQRTIAFLDSACHGVREARRQRLGTHSPQAFWDEVSAINKSVAATQNGFLLKKKFEWFDHDALKRETDALKGVFVRAQEILESHEVSKALRVEGFDAGALFRRARLGVMRCERFKELVLEHEQLVQKVNNGEPLDVYELDRVERLLSLDFGLLAEKTISTTEQAVNNAKPWLASIKSQPHDSRIALLAALAIGVLAGISAR